MSRQGTGDRGQGLSGRATILGLAAAGCAALAALALLATAAVAVYAVVQSASAVASGDTHDGARWATMVFAAGAPFIVGYAARAGYIGSRAILARGAWPKLQHRVPPLAIVALIALGFQGTLAAGSYFTGDDWLHLVYANALPLNLGYATRPVFIHYAPGLRLGYWVLEHTAPLSWGAGLAAMLVLFLGSIVLLHRICTRLFGDRRSNLLLTLLFGTSILLVTSFLWFADGLHKLPSTFFSLLAIDAFLTYRFTRSRWALALCVASVSVGSLFYVKALLVPLYLVLIRVLFLEERPRRAARLLWAERWTWLAFAPTVAIYLWNYQLSYSHTRAPAPSLHLIGNYLWLAWFKGVTPALAGVEIGPRAAQSGVVFATVAQLVLIGVVGLSVRRKLSAWRAWVFWGVAFVANASLVGLGRLGSMGLERVGAELRYDTEMAWLLPLALGFAFLSADVAGRPAAAAARRPLLRLRPRALKLGVAGALCAYAVAACATGAAISHEWKTRNSGPAKAYATNVRRDVARLDRKPGGRPTAIDDQTPAFLISSVARPWNRLERLIPTIAPRLRIVVAGTRPLQVGDDGHVGLALLQPVGTGTAVISGTGTMSTSGTRPGDRGGCVSAGRSGAGLHYATKRNVAGQSLYALLQYDVRGRSSRPGSIAGHGPSGSGRLALDAPHGQTLVNLGRTLDVSLPGRASVCVRRIAVGWLGANGR